jgi:hypothetical protein
MWPNQYIEWARQVHPILTRVVANVLAQPYLGSNPRLNVDTPEIVRDIVHYSFDLASRRSYRLYFGTEAQFRWWITGIACTRLRNVLLERPEYNERIHALPPHLLQPFGWVVLDAMANSEVARQLGLSVAEVEKRVLAAQRAVLG